ncbi:Hypothetical protein HPV225_0129 [Helicobacter pylori v225d]|uniref:DUF874 family protein n=1 Tax=Helicobacter pylori TaxID=210 RepID=UPI0001D8EADA|nr:DUF874 family protein [Helicobacter pylori]ADI34227.1 Hypothetical protein HPV225_0129 [Helicobacter pylori v225d]
MPIIRVLVMLATMMMKLVKMTKEKKVFKNVGMSVMGIAFWEAIKDSIKKQIKKSNWICGNVRTADDYLKTHPNSWFNSAIGATTITAMLMNVCFADDQSKKEVAEAQKEAESARDRANKSGIELEQEKQKTSNIETSNQIKVEQEKQKTSNIETSNQIKTEQEKQKTEQERQKTIKTQKDFIKDLEQNCKENHGQFFIEKGGIKDSIAIEVEAECKTPKPTKTNQTPIQPKHLPNSKQPHSQRGSKAQELIAYLQKELESLPYSQKAIAKQVNFYRPSSIAYLELDPRDFNVAEEWQNENLKIRSKAQAKMLEMRNPQANLSGFQSFSIIQNIVADINKEIEAAANTEKKAEKVGYGYSKRM